MPIPDQPASRVAPSLGLAQRRLRCRFQATKADFGQFGEGTAECMTQFLRELGQAEANGITWSIQRYRTTLSADFPMPTTGGTEC